VLVLFVSGEIFRLAVRLILKAGVIAGTVLGISISVIDVGSGLIGGIILGVRVATINTIAAVSVAVIHCIAGAIGRVKGTIGVIRGERSRIECSDISQK